jgi:soluble lytic murein transglycosylase-like protein
MRLLRPPASTQPARFSRPDVTIDQYSFRYIFQWFCFILVVTMPALAASPEALNQPRMTVVRADTRTGRLVRSSVAPRVVEVPEELSQLIDRIALENGVESALVHSVILTESNYDPSAVSPKGAMGLMQLIPSTAKRFGVNDPFSVAENIQGGVRYLHFLLDYFQNDYSKTIAAYNAGEAAVDKFHGIPPYPETRNYVTTVGHNLRSERAKKETKTASATPVNAEPRKTVIAFTGADGKLYYRTP